MHADGRALIADRAAARRRETEVGAAGFALLRGLLSPGALRDLASAAQERLARIADGANPAGAAPGARWLPTASSLQVDRPLLAELLAALSSSELPAIAEARLGPSPRVLRDQAWLRRQYPPGAGPALHRPHAWHQDGALHARFAEPGEPLLEMLTLWIPLTACGVDAPGLEILDAHSPALLSPAELLAVAARCTSRSPRLRAGDALLMGGGAVHRTFVSEAMSRPRTSIELRMVPAAPAAARLAAEPRWALPRGPAGPAGQPAACRPRRASTR